MARVVPIQLSAALGHVPCVEQVCDYVVGNFGQRLLPMRAICVLLNRCPIKWCCNGVKKRGTFNRFVDIIEVYTRKKTCLLNACVTNIILVSSCIDEAQQMENSFLAS